MKYRLTAKVDGQLRLRPGVTEVCGQQGDTLVELVADVSGRVTHVRLTAPIPPESASQFQWTMRPPSEGRPAAIRITHDPEVARSVLAKMQLLESVLAFGFKGRSPLRRILWDEAMEELVPEEGEDRAEVSGIQVSHSKRDETCVVPEEVFAGIVAKAPLFEELCVPLAFHREGMNDHLERRFLQSFHNFYFVVEAMFARGKFSEREVLKAFGSSKLLSTICEGTIAAFEKSDAKHWAVLKELAATERLNTDVQGIQTLLFRLRGGLRHYSKGSKKLDPSPFREREVEPLALLAMLIASGCLNFRIREIRLETEGP
jgi:hypothetical protein